MRISDWSSDVCSSDLIAREHGESLDDIAQLANIAGPVMAFEPLHRGRCELAVGKSRTAPRLDEVVAKRGDVAPAVAQRRQRDWHDAAAVEKTLAQPAIRHEHPQCAVARRDDAPACPATRPTATVRPL